MRTRFKTAGVVALLLIGGPLWAQAPDQTLAVSFGCEAINGDASTYEIWLYNDLQPPKLWDDAQVFAASRDLRGETGHLATFQDATEEECVLEQARGLGLLDNEQLWIGLEQDPHDPHFSEPAGGWGWVGEPGNHYRNWGSGEPNNAGGNENHGTIGRYGYTIHDGHNDEDPNRGTLYGFVVEYDVAALGEVPLECDPTSGDCTIEIPSADPENNTIVLPTGDGGTADVGVFLIEETCPVTADVDGSAPYGVRQVPFGLLGETIPVPDYLCADRWILISSELADVEIISGVVEALFDPDDFGLTGNDCASNQVLAGEPLPDPVATDLMTYLPTDATWGADPGSPRLDPFMQETTYDCENPSRGRMKGNRYFGVGLNFNFPNAATPQDQVNELISLTRRKLERLEEAILEARRLRVIKQGDARKMLRKVQGAISDVDQFKFDKARQKIVDLFGKFLDATLFNTANAGGFNFQGEGVARSSNVLFLLDVYIRPYY